MLHLKVITNLMKKVNILGQLRILTIHQVIINSEILRLIEVKKISLLDIKSQMPTINMA